ncbi:hypothetical protein AB6A40_002236 [Gnathostoma spinigerum]|uniref:Solute carrier family 35 member F6 n=1 Tax=Gnathostoma spinigerum TaxID=75299 RepID=A0ABD6EFS6_9BILA
MQQVSFTKTYVSFDRYFKQNMDDDQRRHAIFSVFLAVLMVITGSINTLAAKWADSLKVHGKLFNHPFVQAICMFFGEFLCLLTFLIVHYWEKRKWKRQVTEGSGGLIVDINPLSEPRLPQFNILLFAIPALCDVLGTSIMYIGLNLTQASSFQMLRGAVIIFTGLFSVAFLGSKLLGYRWIGMGSVTVGLVIVGVTDIMFDSDPKDDLNGIVTGDLLIVMAQIVVAIQMVVEQKLLTNYDVPALLAVGLEGLFGMIILTVLLFPMYFIHVPSAFSTNPQHRLEDVINAVQEVIANPLIGVALALTVISIAFFNFAGISVTKELSATTRMVLDSVRTLVIWAVSIPLFGQKFIPLQLLGFALLILGMFIYNDLVIGPYFRKKILPQFGDGCCARCWLTICGVDLPEGDRESLVGNDEINDE